MSHISNGPDSYYQAQQDQEHLRLLALFHYIYGGLIILGSCIFIFHIVIGLGMLLSPGSFGSGNQAPPPAAGWMFTLMGTGAILAGWTLGGLTIYAGKCLKEHRADTFITVISALNCLNVPLGTLLGVFTLITINRPSVKPLFQSRRPGSTWFEQMPEPRAADYDVPSSTSGSR